MTHQHKQEKHRKMKQSIKYGAGLGLLVAHILGAFILIFMIQPNGRVANTESPYAVPVHERTTERWNEALGID